MRDGSDAIADWPILNALLNVGGGRDVGERPPRRRRRDRQLDPRGHGRRRRRHRRGGRAARARAHDRSRARASCATPTRATTRRSSRRASTGSTCRRRAASTAYELGPASDGASRLLVRDLAQLATPAGAARPRRSAARRSREVDVRRGRVRPLRGGRDRGGRADARPAGRSTATSRSSTAAGSARSRASSTATRTRASPATASSEFALRAAGATYEELHAAGGGILSTVRATRAAGEDELHAAVARHRGWMLRAGTTTFEAKSGYGLDRETELAQLRAVAAAGGVPTWLGAHAVPPEFDDADAYLDFALAEVLPEAAQLAEAADVFLERGAFDVDAGAPLPRGVPRRRARAAPARRPVHRGGRGRRSRSSSARARSTISRRPGRTASRALAASDVVGVLLPASALFLGRPMPPARALVDAGAAIALATDFNPGSAFCESLPLVCSLACTQLRLSPGGGARRLHGQRGARARPRRPDRPARAGLRRRRRPARRARLALPRLPPRRRRRRTRWSSAARSRGRRGIIGAMPTQKQRRRRAKEKRHEYELVYIDDGGSRRGRADGRRHARAARRRQRSTPSALPRGAGARSRRRGAACSSAGAHLRARSCSASSFCSRPSSTIGAARASADRLLHRRDLHPVQLLHGPLRLPRGQRRVARDPSRGQRRAADSRPRGPRVDQLALGPIGTNCYVVRAERGRGEAVVVDPSGDAAEIRLSSRGSVRACAAILVTHGHFDHLVGVADLAEGTGAPVYMPDGERALLESPDGFTPPGVRVRACDARRARSPGDETLELAGISFRRSRVPGHSPGAPRVLRRRLPLLGRRPLRRLGRPHRPPGRRLGRRCSPRSALLVERFPPETVVYPGHGPPTTLGDELAAQPVPRRAPRGADA